MIKLLARFKEQLPLIVILLICVALYGLNTRNEQLTATNKRLVQLSDNKDARINELRAQNNMLVDDINSVAAQLKRNNDIMMAAQADKAKSERDTRVLLQKIQSQLADDPCAAAPAPHAAVEQLRNAAQAAGGVSAHQTPGSADTRNTHR